MASKGTLRVRIAGDAGPLKKTLRGATGSIGKFAAGAATAVGAAAVFSVKAFADFDQAMTNSTAIMGDVSDAMRKDMSDAAREVAKTTKFSATEAAESYFFLASAGMNAEQAIGALPRVAAFAQAGNFDMALATDLATDAQSALGLTSDDTAKNLENLTRTTDVLVKANTLANASVEQFATSMTSKAGAALKNVNKDIEEGTSVLAVFADQGIKGERAGTILMNTLDGLTVNARKNSDAFADLGVSVFDSEGDMRNMADIVADLEVGLAGMSTEQKLAALSSLGFTKRTNEGILALLGNSDALREYEKELRKAGGTTDEVADKQLQTFWAQLGLLKDQLIDVGLTIGETLMPHLMNLVGWAQDKMPIIEEKIDTGLEDMERWWDEHGETVVETVETAWNILTELFDIGFQTLDGLHDIKLGIMEDDWGTFWEGVKKLSDAGWNNLSIGSSDAMTEINLNFAAGFVRFRRSAQNKWSSFLIWVSRLPGRMMNFFRSLPGQLAGLGADAVRGLRIGFEAQWNRFTSWVSDLPGAGIVRNLASSLGIGSPSKVLAKEIGAPAVQGIEMGMQSELGNLQRMSDHVGHQILRDLGKYQELSDSKWRTLRRSGVMQGMGRDEFFDQVAGTPEQRAMLRQTGTADGGGRMVIEIRSGGSEVDDLLVEILARAVSARGGDVQRVIGQGSS